MIIFVPSVQHTGTWFTINFLKQFIPTAKELGSDLEGNEVEGKVWGQHIEDAIVHTHLPISRFSEFDTNYPFQRQWYYNLTYKRSLPIDAIRLMATFFKTVIPIRDPLAAILTREARHPAARHFYIVDGFAALAQEFANHPNVKFLPIDLPLEVDGRKELLTDVIKHCGIESDEDIINKTATSWEPQNITPSNRFAELYRQGDIGRIKHLLGDKWAEVEYLKNMASIILPFMADLGYTKDDLKLW